MVKAPFPIVGVHPVVEKTKMPETSKLRVERV